jgi:hypothetical protein
MHIIEFPESNLTRYIPADLSECDKQQYIDMCELMFFYCNQKITSSELLTHSVYKLMKMKPVLSKTEEDAELKGANIVLLQELIESTFFTKIQLEDKTFQYQINQNYIDNPVPVFKPLWRNYYGPDNAFKNVKIGEYTDALKLFLQFNSTGDIELLYEFVATLYRPKSTFNFISKHFVDYDGDCRIRYNSNKLDKRIKALKHSPIGFIWGVYLYFASFQTVISSGEIPWGDKTLNLSLLYSGGEQAPEIDAADLGLDSLIFALAESGAFGDFDKVQQTSFWTMIIKMYDSRVKQLQIDKQQENANNQSPS